MEDKDKRQGWLRDLKAGDKIIIKSTYYTNIKIIDKITPTGRIKIGETYYGSEGGEIGGYTWGLETLYKWTQEEENKILQEIELWEMRSYLKGIDWIELDFDLVREIYEKVKGALL